MRAYEHAPHAITKELPERTCSVCQASLEVGQYYIELFRPQAAQGERKMLFVHVTCAIQALETWVQRKQAKKGVNDEVVRD